MGVVVGVVGDVFWIPYVDTIVKYGDWLDGDCVARSCEVSDVGA